MDGKDLEVREFSPLEACRHVFKHVLNPAEQWQSFYGSTYNLATLRSELESLGCRGYVDQEWDRDKHGPQACANFIKCNAILESLRPVYVKFAMGAIREGAYEKDPRHTHSPEKPKRKPSGKTVLIPASNFFLSDSGVLAMTHENKREKEIAMRSAFRPLSRYGRKNPRTTLEFVMRGKEKVYNDLRHEIEQYHTVERWRPSLK